MISELLTACLQRWFNQLLSLDAATQTQLHQLAGKRLLIRCSKPSIGFYINIRDKHIEIEPLASSTHNASAPQHSDNTQLVPDAVLEGSASALLGLLMQTNPAALSNPNISLRGDFYAFEQLFSLTQSFSPDYEEPLANIVGDISAHSIGKTLRTLNKGRKQINRALRQHSEDFLKHEAKLTPSHHELASFQSRVETLWQETERLQAKLQQLTRSRN